MKFREGQLRPDSPNPDLSMVGIVRRVNQQLEIRRDGQLLEQLEPIE